MSLRASTSSPVARSDATIVSSPVPPSMVMSVSVTSLPPTSVRLRESAPAPHPAYLNANLVIDPNQAITEPRGINRFLPLPTFQKPFFVWRDETVMEQGGNSGRGRDVPVPDLEYFTDYILSPFLGGNGRRPAAGPGILNQGTWENANNFNLVGEESDDFTGGLVGAIALPLMADFWTYCDSPSLPEGNGSLAQVGAR